MKKYLSVASFVCAMLFATAGMWIPPQGEIDLSVLILIAQLLVLCATFLGISPPKPSQEGGLFDSEWLKKNAK